MRKIALVAVAALLAGSAACGGDGGQRGRYVAPTATPTPVAAPVRLSITPEPGTRDAPLSTEIGTEVSGGTVTEVVLSSEDGDTVPGAMRADDSSWVPDVPLKPDTTYTAAVTATGSDGRTATAETSFTTMSSPGRRTGTGLYLFDGHEYGVAMPVVVEFLEPVPEEYRAGVQKRMFVTTDPPQPGVWHWVGDGRQAFYRARDFWKPGTTLSVRIALEGHPTGDGWYGDTDRRATVTIGSASRIEVDNATKQLSFYSDGDLVRTMPVSLGKPSTPSSSGTMVIMSKERTTVFDTFAELGPVEGYRIDIEYAMRLTWGGEFIHAAPWSVADQGVRNVSHGCVNLSTDNARWLFERAKIGDPVIVKGTERRLEHGNGWTAWNVSWEEFVAASALPVPDAGPAPATTN
ncbi:MAG TPA: Ig-like domain-containing protein [Natronosporangium sp.]|nr:Ig-like domain-containing protein [Natronosporangium sp.]